MTRLLVLASLFGAPALVFAADVSATAASPLTQDAALKYAAGDWAGARQAAAAAVEAEPNSAQASLQLAMALLKLDLWPEAEAAADRAVALGYGRAAVYNVRSAARAKQGRFDAALVDAERAVSANPGGPIGYVNRAVAKAGLKRPNEEILYDYRRAFEVDPRYAGAYESARRRYEGKIAPPVARAPAPAPVPAPVPAKTPDLEQAPAPQAQPPSAPASAPEPAPSAEPGRDWLKLAVSALAGGLVLFLLWLLRSGWKSHRGMQVRFGALIAPPPSVVELTPGSVVAGLYIVGKLVEKNGPLEVYEARDLEDAPRVLKRLAPRVETSEAQFAFARKAAALRHPAIETVESVFHEGPRVCLACAPLAGEPLARLRERLPERRWTPEQALRPFQSVCEALAEAHRQGVAHGAINSGSIVVDRGRASLRDFGLAGAGEPQDDVRALAACFAEALTGRAAQESTTGLSSGIAAVFERAFSGGFRSAEELFQAYRTAVVPLVQ